MLPRKERGYEVYVQGVQRDGKWNLPLRSLHKDGIKRAMNKLTTTYETTREFDEKGNVTHEIHTETREEPDCASYTVTTSTTSDEDIAEMLDGLIELQEPTPSILDIITGAAGIASIIASVCLIAKTIKRK